jgi:multiple sugar transport system permease protein
MVTSDPNRERFERPRQLLSNRTKAGFLKTLQGTLLVLLLVYVAFPTYWAFSSAFKAGQELFSGVAFVPLDPTLVHFERLFFDTMFLTYFRNSVLVGLGAVAITSTLALLGGYGLTRSSFRGKRNLARSVLFSYMFPPMLLALPMYAVFYNLGLLNSYLSLMLAHTAISLPFCLWLMWQYFQTLPVSYEESAWINGATRIQTLRTVVLPMAQPAVIAVAIFTFAITWNDFTFAVILMTDSAKYTLPIGVNAFIERTAVHWGLLISAAFLIMLPALTLVVFLQKYLILGFQVTEE